MNFPCPLSRSHDSSEFDCGVEVLNVYLKRYAYQNQHKEAARTYVLLIDKRIIGYYTLVFCSVSWQEAPSSMTKGLARYPVPALLIARLAVDKSHAGQGLGADLLKDALERAISASEIAGLHAILVDAKNDSAKKFYQKHGFHLFENHPNRLFISMKELKRSTK